MTPLNKTLAGIYRLTKGAINQQLAHLDIRATQSDLRLYSGEYPDQLQKTIATANCVDPSLLAVGVFFEVNSRTIMMAGEGIAAAFAFRVKRAFAVMKVRCDIGMIVMAIGLALLFRHQLVGVREGTLIAALLTGRFVGVIEARAPRLTAWVRA
ncbi:hypothetical protein [Lacticaseibacillus absianus]|uniref:hypothetical protein n=1 Tax=Lacticaseibacillus absianus TaxID=2729623 RepID=UPI0015CDB426|nr:hypothetical protein [Lacticaseibacillus absianus]